MSDSRLWDHLRDAIRDRISPADVLRQSGVDLQRAGSGYIIKCRWHEEKTASCRVRDNFVRCYGCGITADIFAIWNQLHGGEHIDAIKALADQAGIRMPEVTPEERKRVETQKRTEDLCSLVAEVAAAALWTDTAAAEKAREYLHKRGIGEAIAKDARLGLLPDWNTATQAIKERGQGGIAAGIEAGLIAVKKSGRGFRDQLHHCLIFPVFKAGLIVTLIGRPVPDLLDGDDRAKTQKLSSGASAAPPAPALYWTGPYPKDFVVVVEGEIDALTLGQCGIPTVGLLGSTSAKDAVAARQICRGSREVYQIPDADEAGRKAAMQLAACLDGKLRVLTPWGWTQRGKDDTGPKGDPNDALLATLAGVEGDLDTACTFMRDQVLDAMPAAPTWVVWETDRLVTEYNDRARLATAVTERIVPVLATIADDVQLSIATEEVVKRTGVKAGPLGKALKAEKAKQQRASERRTLEQAQTQGQASDTAAGARDNDGFDDRAEEHTRLTDLGNARRLVRLHGQNIRYCFKWDTWFVWDGTRWAWDDGAVVMLLARYVIPDLLRDAAILSRQAAETSDSDARKALQAKSEEHLYWAKETAKVARLNALVNLARSEPDIPILYSALDADPWLLNVLNGTIDLRTGELLPHDRANLCTKIVNVAYDVAATCPTWDAFLLSIFDGDKELVSFVRRAVGYSLTGDVREQCLFFLHGGGSNGKSTFIEIVLAILGDYADSAAPDLLMSTSQEKHPTDVADLYGLRFVRVMETDEGGRFAEAKLKLLTGGDRLKARRMREDYWSFTPIHKVWMGANHKPNVRGNDHGFWRRMRLIPFLVQYVKEEEAAKDTPKERLADLELPDKLRAELPGILRWAVQGCLDWQQDGLGQSEAISKATSKYREEVDLLGAFIATRCLTDSDKRAGALLFVTTFCAWLKQQGEREWSAGTIKKRLVERGFEQRRSGTNGSIEWHGIGVVDEAHGSAPGATEGLKGTEAVPPIIGNDPRNSGIIGGSPSVPFSPSVEQDGVKSREGNGAGSDRTQQQQKRREADEFEMPRSLVSGNKEIGEV